MPRVDIITNVIYANQHFALTLMQMFNFQRRSWKPSFLSPNPPPPRLPRQGTLESLLTGYMLSSRAFDLGWNFGILGDDVDEMW